MRDEVGLAHPNAQCSYGSGPTNAAPELCSTALSPIRAPKWLVFTPGETDVAYAERVVAAFAEAEGAGSAAIQGYLYFRSSPVRGRAPIQPEMHPVAVEFDFVEPVWPFGRARQKDYAGPTLRDNLGLAIVDRWTKMMQQVNREEFVVVGWTNPDREGVLRPAAAGALTLELAVRLLIRLGLLEGGDLRLGQQDAILRGLGFECLQTQLTAHPRRRSSKGRSPDPLGQRSGPATAQCRPST
jgi:hypothetical protein